MRFTTILSPNCPLMFVHGKKNGLSHFSPSLMCADETALIGGTDGYRLAALVGTEQ